MGLVREDLPRHRGPAAATRRPARQVTAPGKQAECPGRPTRRGPSADRGWRALRAGYRPGPCLARLPTSQDRCRPLLLVPALNPCLLQQLTVLLLRHPLAAFLDDRAHQAPLSSAQGRRACHHAHPRTGAGQTPEIRTDVNADRSRSPQDYLLPPSAVTVWSAIRPLCAGKPRDG